MGAPASTNSTNTNDFLLHHSCYAAPPLNHRTIWIVSLWTIRFHSSLVHLLMTPDTLRIHPQRIRLSLYLYQRLDYIHLQTHLFLRLRVESLSSTSSSNRSELKASEPLLPDYPPSAALCTSDVCQSLIFRGKVSQLLNSLLSMGEN